MDPASLAAALVGAQMSSVQMAMSAKMLRMNADSGASVAKLIDSAQQNVTNLANVAAGVGQNLDISV
ncbi:MAG TPA: hypothetical protein VHT93_11220 [Pseudolabrys sp.]|jgi:hypothetical protein|nr:hypothetical protein [Pseudolabrys sp.]